MTVPSNPQPAAVRRRVGVVLAAALMSLGFHPTNALADDGLRETPR